MILRIDLLEFVCRKSICNDLRKVGDRQRLFLTSLEKFLFEIMRTQFFEETTL